jgi:hypothetical protein
MPREEACGPPAHLNCMAITEAAVVREIEAMLKGGHTHATFDNAVKDFPEGLCGVVPEGLPYSAWQIVDHIRVAQRDMLDFSDNADGTYEEKNWPQDYWLKDAAPPTALAWDEAIAEVHADQKRFFKLMDDAKDLGGPFAWGSGQSLLKEALQIADHNAYHVGELIVVRRLLGCWKK